MTETVDEIALISDSLELYAQRPGDMAHRVYKRFFELNPEAAALMEYSDKYIRDVCLHQCSNSFSPMGTWSQVVV